jgi:hypothetical protein
MVLSPQDIARFIISNRMKLTGHVTCIREIRNEHKVLVERPDWIGPIGRERRR